MEQRFCNCASALRTSCLCLLLFNNFLIFQLSFSASYLVGHFLLIYDKFRFYLKAKKYLLLQQMYEYSFLYKTKSMS